MADMNAMTNRTETTTKEATRNNKYFAPRVDIFETDSELVLHADMPGVDPKDIDLRYENGELIVQGRAGAPVNHGHLILSEFDEGDYYRAFQIHESIDSTRIEAECKNGVLKLVLPKAEHVKPRKIAIKGE